MSNGVFTSALACDFSNAKRSSSDIRNLPCLSKDGGQLLPTPI
jgi:hypothetical protein